MNGHKSKFGVALQASTCWRMLPARKASALLRTCAGVSMSWTTTLCQLPVSHILRYKLVSPLQALPLLWVQIIDMHQTCSVHRGLSASTGCNSMHFDSYSYSWVLLFAMPRVHGQSSVMLITATRALSYDFAGQLCWHNRGASARNSSEEWLR